MLPTTPAGHCGAPRGPGTIATFGRPSFASAARAQARLVVNSLRRFSTAVVMNASSSGNSTVPGASSNASAAATPGGRISSIISSLRGGEYLTRNARPGVTGLPFAGITEGDLLERHPVMPCGPGNMQMPIDHCHGTESDMPVSRARGATPLRKFWVTQDLRGLTNEREMVHQDDRQTGVQGGQPPLGRLDPCPAPRFPVRVRIRVQQHFVGTDHACLVGVG